MPNSRYTLSILCCIKAIKAHSEARWGCRNCSPARVTRVLLQRYRPLWGDLKKQATERAEQQRRSAAAAAQAKSRQASARAASSARAPVAVHMSDKQREAVEGLVQSLAAADLLGVDGSFDCGGADSAAAAAVQGGGLYQQQQQEGEGLGDAEELAEAASAFIDGLIRGGFSATDAAAAVTAVGAAAGIAAAAAATAASAAAVVGGRRVTRVYRSHEGLQPYLDWLCIRLPVERLPSRYRPGASRVCVCVCAWGGRGGVEGWG
mgnify:CR=1 FL=1